MIDDAEIAFGYAQKAIDIIVNNLGENNPITAGRYRMRGCIYSVLGRDTDALKDFETSITICKNVYGVNHAEVAECYASIGRLYLDMNDHNKAIDYFEKVIDIQKSINYQRSPMLIYTYSNLSQAFMNQNNIPVALDYLDKAYKLAKLNFGDVNEYVAHSLTLYAAMYVRSGDYKKAFDYMQKSIEVYSQLPVVDGYNMIVNYCQLSWVSSALGEYSKAMNYLFKVYDIVVERNYSVLQFQAVYAINQLYGVIKSDSSKDAKQAMKLYNKWKKQHSNE